MGEEEEAPTSGETTTDAAAPAKEARYPPAWRLALGFLIAPPFLALMLTFGSPLGGLLQSMAPQSWPVISLAAYVGYPGALLFGLPIFVLLGRRNNGPNAEDAIFAGIGMAVLPLILFMVPVMIGGDGFLLFVVMLVASTMFGAVAGVAFWLAAFMGTSPPLDDSGYDWDEDGEEDDDCDAASVAAPTSPSSSR